MRNWFSALPSALALKLYDPVATVSSLTNTLRCMKSCTPVGVYGVDFLPTSRAETVFQSADACVDDLLVDHSRAIGPIWPASYMPDRCTPTVTALASAASRACEVITMDAITSRLRTPLTRPTR